MIFLRMYPHARNRVQVRAVGWQENAFNLVVKSQLLGFLAWWSLALSQTTMIWGAKCSHEALFELLVEGVLVSTAHCDLPILIAIIPVGLDDLTFSAEGADLGFFPLQALEPDGDTAMEDGGIGAVFHIAFGCKQHLAVVAAAGRAGTDP